MNFKTLVIGMFGVGASLLAASDLVVEQVDYDAGTSSLTLRWSSAPGESFDIQVSGHLEQWTGVLASGVAADGGGSTTRTFDLSQSNWNSEDRLFIRVCRTSPFTPPNIVFLLSDDQATYSLRCYGNDEMITPEQDRIASDGMIFDRNYVTSPHCMPARGTIFSGMHEYKHGASFETANFTPEIWNNSYPTLLQNAGYRTGFSGKIGLEGLQEIDRGDGFDVYAPGPQRQSSYTMANIPGLAQYAAEFPHATRALGAWGRDFISSSVALGQPFCMSISFKAPHKETGTHPFDPIFANDYLDPVTGSTMSFTKPGNFGRDFADLRPPQSRSGKMWDRFVTWGYQDDYDNAVAPYYREILGIDAAIKMIRDELAQQGIADNTVIIYTSDNGYLLGSHGFAAKNYPMEEASRTPLMIYDPRAVTSGQQMRCKRLTANLDIAPTILDLAGVDIPANMDGLSLVPLLNDPTTGGHDQVAIYCKASFENQASLTVVSNDIKYSYWWGSPAPVEELFDLNNDPLEINNLASDANFAGLLNTMRAKYDEEQQAWVQNCVQYGGYPGFGNNFVRTIP